MLTKQAIAADADLIENAPTDIEALIKEVERLRTMLEIPHDPKRQT